jgi:hypothetical protein
MNNKIDSKPLNVTCCFCTNTLRFDLAVEITLKPNPYSVENQVLYCHKTCLSKLVHEKIPIHPDIRP